MNRIGRDRHIYVASSWRNLRQPVIVQALRDQGFTVYDFRNPIEGDRGFGWSPPSPYDHVYQETDGIRFVSEKTALERTLAPHNRRMPYSIQSEIEMGRFDYMKISPERRYEMVVAKVEAMIKDGDRAAERYTQTRAEARKKREERAARKADKKAS